MRTIKQYLEAAKARKENGEEGFSLVELIVVVAILGILVAVAIPVFGGIQDQAEKSAVAAAAANGAVAVTAAIADDPTTGMKVADAMTAANNQSKITLTTSATDGSKVEDVCVAAVSKADANIKASSGPGC